MWNKCAHSGGHCITVSRVQQGDCDTGLSPLHVIRLYGLNYNI